MYTSLLSIWFDLSWGCSFPSIPSLSPSLEEPQICLSTKLKELIRMFDLDVFTNRSKNQVGFASSSYNEEKNRIKKWSMHVNNTVRRNRRAPSFAVHKYKKRKATESTPKTYTPRRSPWYGDQMPRTLSLVLVTGFFVRFSFSPLASLRRSVCLRMSEGSRLRTQIVLSLPFTKWPRMMGCLRGRGATRISIWGCSRANAGRFWRRNSLRFVSTRATSILPNNSFHNNSLHAPRTTSPVTVVEIKTFALQDEGADAILRGNTWSAL